MGRWLEHSVAVDIAAPVDLVWAVWSDLEAMPLWMRWIESVKTLDDPDLTEWTLAAPRQGAQHLSRAVKRNQAWIRCWLRQRVGVLSFDLSRRRCGGLRRRL